MNGNSNEWKKLNGEARWQLLTSGGDLFLTDGYGIDSTLKLVGVSEHVYSRVWIPRRTAKHLLDFHNTQNRRVNDRRVKCLTRIIDRGQFIVNQQSPIQIDLNGAILEGQKRLEALLNSDVDGIEVAFCVGADPKVREILGDSEPRRRDHQMQMASSDNAWINQTINSTFGVAVKILGAGIAGVDHREDVSSQDRAVCLHYWRRSLEFASTDVGNARAGVRAALFLAHAYYNRIGNHAALERLEEFKCVYRENTPVKDTSSDSAAIELRRHVRRVDKKSADRKDDFKKTEWAIREFLKESPVRRCSSCKEFVFPMPIVTEPIDRTMEN